MSEQESYVPIPEVADHFSVSISTVRAWIRTNKIPKSTYIKVGTTYRFKISGIENALTASDEPAAEATEEVETDQEQLKLY